MRLWPNTWPCSKATLDEARETARLVPSESGAFVLEIRAISWFNPGSGLKELK